MSGMMTFGIEYQTVNADVWPEMAERIKNFTPAFEAIVPKWAQDNKDKFAAAIGTESSGAMVDPEVFWQPLKASTIGYKRKHGFPDQTMVRTGDLMRSLTDPERFFHEETPETAAFGIPTSPESERAAMYNFLKRQTIFLSVDDQRMIDKTVQSYLELGPDFKSIQFAKGLQNLADKKEVAQMQIDFSNEVKS